LQNGDDLVFGESGFAHGDLLQEHNQYAGRSLNVNGPLYRDAYKSTSLYDWIKSTVICFGLGNCCLSSQISTNSVIKLHLS
ncbi:hypothetical protein VAI81_26515, partial [Klebsiella pneumoniae]